MAIECNFCGAVIGSVEAAVEVDWVHGFFYAGEESETAEPVCLKCRNEHLEPDENGTLICVTD